MANSPVQDVTFGTALSISLNNYYDLLKGNIGTLVSDEYLQLKLVADTVDVSSKRYPWYSFYNLLQRADQAIAPLPIAGVIGAAASPLWPVYERFLRKLRTYVVIANLTAAETQQVSALDTDMDGVRAEIMKWQILDRTNWKTYADAMGYSVGDNNAFLQWRIVNGHGANIQRDMSTLNDLMYQQRTILNRKYPEPTDKEVIDAEAAFYSPGMRIRYPVSADYLYDNGDKFTLTYLAGLPLDSGALFDDRRLIGYNEDISSIETKVQGALVGSFSRTTTKSDSITTDWNASASVSYAFISVNASASEHTQIQEEFSHGTKVELSSASAFMLKLQFPGWFNPLLFVHKRVLDNIHNFEEFFGPKGSLLYTPTNLVLVRGFKVTFTSSQNWTYDYQHKFSASGGGGFNAFGIGFGASGSYSSDQKQHIVDVSGTSLSITDDPSTVRFVGYVVKKNNIFNEAVEKAAIGSFGKATVDKLSQKQPKRANALPRKTHTK